MARARSTARVSHEGDETEMTEIAPISKIMRRSRLVVQEGVIAEGTSIAEVEKAVIEVESDNESEDDDSILCPTKLSHVEFGRSTIKAEDLIVMKKLENFGENDDELVRFAREEIILEPKEDEVVVFKRFFKAGLRFPLYEMICEVLMKFEIYLHQLTRTLLSGSAFTSGFFEAKERALTPKVSDGYMSFITRRRQGLLPCTKTSDATTLHTERIRRLP
jgi:hypothetical protein